MWWLGCFGGAHSQTGSLSITHASCISTDKIHCLQGVKRSTAIEYATAPCGTLSPLHSALLSSLKLNWLWIKWSLWQLEVAQTQASPKSPILLCWLPERAPSHMGWTGPGEGLGVYWLHQQDGAAFIQREEPGPSRDRGDNGFITGPMHMLWL